MRALRMTRQTKEDDVDALYNVEMSGRDLDAVAAHDAWASVTLVQQDVIFCTVPANHTPLKNSISQLRTLLMEDLLGCGSLQAPQVPQMRLAKPLPHY